LPFIPSTNIKPNKKENRHIAHIAYLPKAAPLGGATPKLTGGGRRS
jgi:hypothetical protein